MKIADALEAVQEMRPGHVITPEKMKRWLSTLDRQVWEELIIRRMPDDNTPDVFCGYQDSTDDNTCLMIPSPDAEDIYPMYLAMKMDLHSGEMADYINSAELFNAAYTAFAKKYARSHRQKMNICFTNN